MKKWTGFFITLIVLLLVAYFAIGFIIKSTLNKNINSIPKTTVFSILLDKYQRGWFSSQAVLSFKMHIPAQSTTNKEGKIKTELPFDLDLNIPLLIKHGPFIVTNNGLRFGLGLVTSQPETNYVAFLNYLNKIVFKYSLPSFIIEGKIGQNDGDFKLNWQGLISWLCVSSNWDQINGDLKLLGLTGTANKQDNPKNNLDFRIGEITYNFKLDRHLEWLWLGQSHFRLPSVVINLTGQAAFELTEFDFSAGSNVHSDGMDLYFKSSLQKIFANNQNYGPGIFHLIIKNLDPVILAKINQEQFTMMQNNSDANIMKLALLAQLPKLLAKGTVIELSKATLSLPEGKIIANFKLSFPKNEGGDLAEIMKKMQGEGYFKAPIKTVKTLLMASLNNNSAEKSQKSPDAQIGSREYTNSPAQVVTSSGNDKEKQADTILNDLIKKGFLKIEGTEYIVIFKLENQKIFLNSQLLGDTFLR